MATTQRYVMAPLVALVLWLTWGSTACGSDRAYDQWAYRAYRAAKRDQVGALCEIWFATWRPGEVAKTYRSLADRYAEMETQLDESRCSSSVHVLFMRAERTACEIAEVFGQGTMQDIDVVLPQVKGGGGLRSSSSLTSERGRRVLKLMDDLRAAEEDVIKELGLGNG
jgi:hypothetical protein